MTVATMPEHDLIRHNPMRTRIRLTYVTNRRRNVVLLGEPAFYHFALTSATSRLPSKPFWGKGIFMKAYQP